MFCLDGKVAIVTGGYGHLGASITSALAASGARVIVAARSQQKFNLAFSKRPNIDFVCMDISSTESINSAYAYIIERYHKIDLLVNNAFYCKVDDPEDLLEGAWAHGIEGVLNSVFKCTREVIVHMLKQGAGNVINVSSVYGMQPPDFRIYKDYPKFFNPANYGTAKAAIIHMTKYYAAYYAKDGIRINSISPGAFPSESVQREKKFIDILENEIPLGRIGQPEDLKGLVVFLAGEASKYITGQNIVIDGGWSL